MNLKINPTDIKTLIESYDEKDTDCIIFEEPEELIQAFSKFKRYGGLQERANLMEEMADVYITLEMLKVIYNIEDREVNYWIDKKMQRNLERVK
ncbi:MAG: hypothetical protein HFE90_04755 [Firmicutes bacterium]|nr:hypothetical protein [Bacillota bacterium]